MALTGTVNRIHDNMYEGNGVQNITEQKFMDRVNKGEKINLLQEAPNSVSIEISEEGKNLIQRTLSVRQEGNIVAPVSYEERVKLLQESLKPAQKLHIIIPNIQTNDKLVKSLKGADENIAGAAYSIIQNDLLPHNIGNLTEDERIELISVGLEKARFLADRLEDDKADSFMEAMNTIAKYGMNRKTNQRGNVTYDIRWGAMVGAPDDYISTGELMQKIAPEQYKTYSAMHSEAIKKNDEKLAFKAVRFLINWEINAYKTNSQAIETVKTEQVNWKKNMDATKINSHYTGTDRTDADSFIKSILAQNKTLNADFLFDNLQSFVDSL